MGEARTCAGEVPCAEVQFRGRVLLWAPSPNLQTPVVPARPKAAAQTADRCEQIDSWETPEIQPALCSRSSTVERSCRAAGSAQLRAIRDTARRSSHAGVSYRPPATPDR